MAPCETFQPASSTLSPWKTKQQQKQTQLQPHILGIDVEGLMTYPVPINFPKGVQETGSTGPATD